MSRQAWQQKQTMNKCQYSYVQASQNNKSFKLKGRRNDIHPWKV